MEEKTPITISLTYENQQREVVLKEASWHAVTVVVGSSFRLKKNQYKVFRKDGTVIHAGNVYELENNTELDVRDIHKITTDETCTPPVPNNTFLAIKPISGLVQIMTDLFLGNIYTAKEKELMKRHNIKYIVNVSHNTYNFFPDDFVYCNISVQDKDAANIAQYFSVTNNFIEHSRKNGDGSVLVHCKGGVSRSPTILIAYMMYQYKLSFKHAYGYIKSRKSGINPNPGFTSQLAAYEKQPK